MVIPFSRWKCTIAIILVCLWVWTPFRPTAASGAEAKKPAIKRQTCDVVTTGPLITDSAIPQPLGTATWVFPTFLSFTGGNFSSSWRRVSAGGNYQSLSIPAQLYYGLAPRTEVYLVTPFLQNWAGNVNDPAPNGQRSANFGGLGDIILNGKYLLLDERKYFPAVAAIFNTTFPTGHYRHLNPGNLGTDQLGQGAYIFTPGLDFYKNAPPFLLYGNLWYSMFTDTAIDGVRTYYRDQVTVNLAAEYCLSGPFVLLGEFVSTYDVGRLIGPRANQAPEIKMSIFPALEYIASDKIFLVAGVLIDLCGKNTTSSYSPNLSIFFNF